MLAAEAWSEDLLDRKPLADYLTKSLKSQSASLALSERGLTVALDADWGAGKSFFVTNWVTELRCLGHPVVYFDAWENDIGDEAAISLMAAILAVLRECLPKNATISEKASRLRTDSIKKLRRALVPAVGVVFKGLLKKTTSIAVDELIEVFTEADSQDPQHSKGEMDDILDGLFEAALVEHDSRKEKLAAFKASLVNLLDLICENGNAKPLFVFVDELDRCRPSYAIKLLEEIKHIFGIKDVVYVVSTNIDQLQSSVRAIYGSDFDGRRYLRRLFNREYSLPRVDSGKFADSVIVKLGWKPAKVESGLPVERMTKVVERSLGDVWSLMGKAFGFDYRTQEQVLTLAAEASLVIEAEYKDRPVHILWIFYLSSLYYSSLSLLKKIVLGTVNQAEIVQSLKTDVPIIYNSPEYSGGRAQSRKKANLSAAIGKYFDLSVMPSRKVFDLDAGNIYDYPGGINYILQAELGGRFDGATPPFLSINAYPSLVLNAGYLAASEKDAEM